MISRFRLLLILALLAPAAAPAASWRGGPADGHVDFVARWQGTPVKGSFADFRVEARIDPGQPAGGSITVHVKTSSASTASADVTRAIHGPDWFDVAHRPEAEFVSTSISAGTGGKFDVHGNLTLKGHEKAIDLPMRIVVQQNGLLLAGSVTLDRLDFGIGSGRWAGGGMIAIPVKVDFSVLLHRDE